MPTKAVDLTELPRTDTSEVDVSDFQNANIMCEQNGRLYRMPMKQVENTMFSDFSTLKEYGVCYDHKTKSATLTRVGAAAGKQFAIGIGSEIAINDFKNIYPYSDIKRCTLADDGSVTSYIGDANYIEDGSIGQVMVQFPKFYFKRSIDNANDKEYWYISSEKLTGYAVWPSFLDADGNELDFVYLAAFSMSADSDDDRIGCSVAEQDGTLKYGYFIAENMASARGDNWHNVSVDIWFMYQFLVTVMFATTNSETIFKGYTDDEFVDCVADVESYYSTATNVFVSSDLFDSDLTYVKIHKGMKVDITFDLKKGTYEPTDDDTVEAEDTDTDGTVYQLCTTRRTITDVETVEISDSKTVVKATFSGEAIPITSIDDSMVEVNKYTGICSDIADKTAGVLYNSELNDNPFVLLGVEYPFSSGYTYVNGIVCREGELYVTTNPNLYGVRSSSDTNRMAIDEYKKIGYKASSAGYITKLGYDSDLPWVLMPDETDGTSESGYCDMQTGSPTLAAYDYVYRFGGETSLAGGLFAVAPNNANTRVRSFGRLNCSIILFYAAQ